MYISCNPKTAQRNWIDLARPESKSYKGAPFLPKIAVAVDMFPHTAHTEMVVLFERQKEDILQSQIVNTNEHLTSTEIVGSKPSVVESKDEIC